MKTTRGIRFVTICLALNVPFVLTMPALAATPGVSNIENFIKSIITILTGLAGLIATGFLVIGGLRYITSSGNPESLDHAKKTLLYSVVGLSITIAAFVISTIVTTLATNAFGS